MRRTTHYLPWALGLAVPAVFAVTVVVAVTYPPPAIEVAPAVPTPHRPPVATEGSVRHFPGFSTYPLPQFPAGSPVGPAAEALRAVGAEVHVIDARGWAREVQPDWALCSDDVTYWGNTDVPTGDVFLAAVPVGDPCP